ncbi:MAG: hypothetical protein CMJ45_06185 [Planctomyces sp.]|jgi:Zn-dependent peptidase ImmA (M78 family)/DNA-binding XRE family transcriptional regulator|nr:hypothetical protein [Planctomyces sp.]
MVQEVNANPELVTLARQSRKLTQSQLAKTIEVAQATISKYEAGILPVSNKDLAALSNVLDYPTHFFTRSIRVEGPGMSELFHRKRQAISTNTLHQVYALAEIRRIEIMRLLRSSNQQEWKFPLFPIEDFDDDPEKVARTVRATWQIPPGPIFNVTKAIERAHGVVFGLDFGTRQIDGFSHRSHNMPPLFYLNQDMPPDRWRWTLAHELGHIVMHGEPPTSPKIVEDQANRFAGEFLAPSHELKPQLLGLDYQKLAGLKLYWKISMAALVMRAYHVGAVTERQRRTMFMRLGKAGYRLREPEVTDPPIEPPETPYNLVQFHSNQLEYSDREIQYLLAIGDRDFDLYYRKPGNFSLNVN